MRRIGESVLDILEYLGRGAALGDRPDEQERLFAEAKPVTRQQVPEPCQRSTGGKPFSSGFRILM